MNVTETTLAWSQSFLDLSAANSPLEENLWGQSSHLVQGSIPDEGPYFRKEGDISLFCFDFDCFNCPTSQPSRLSFVLTNLYWIQSEWVGSVKSYKARGISSAHPRTLFKALSLTYHLTLSQSWESPLPIPIVQIMIPQHNECKWLGQIHRASLWLSWASNLGITWLQISAIFTSLCLISEKSNISQGEVC